jgi:hypothetical protein
MLLHVVPYFFFSELHGVWLVVEDDALLNGTFPINMINDINYIIIRNSLYRILHITATINRDKHKQSASEPHINEMLIIITEATKTDNYC